MRVKKSVPPSKAARMYWSVCDGGVESMETLMANLLFIRLRVCGNNGGQLGIETINHRLHFCPLAEKPGDCRLPQARLHVLRHCGHPYTDLNLSLSHSATFRLSA